MELTIDRVLFPSHRSQNNNNSISANSSIHGDIDAADDQSNISTFGTSSGKKPRHHHSPQLAALNELYEKNEHPSLDDRNELAEKLGLETTTVNAWFQNKRASTKKRNKLAPPSVNFV